MGEGRKSKGGENGRYTTKERGGKKTTTRRRPREEPEGRRHVNHGSI